MNWKNWFCYPQILFVFICIYSFQIVTADNLQCENVNAMYLTCEFNCQCRYGVDTLIFCEINPGVQIQCEGPRNFSRAYNCRYCYQLPPDQYQCDYSTSCSSTKYDTYITNCVANPDVLCLGSRLFQKTLQCNWTKDHYWSTTLILSIFLGGFGADRFYLGYVGWGIFKLLSFGGLGIWTLIDVILIYIGYLTPSDGSLYRDL